jgi:hypothetical protein
VAVAGMYIFPPLQQVTVTTNGELNTSLNYDVIKVVALSLILGSAGGTFLSALQGRVLAAINQQKAEVAAAVGKAQVEQVKDNVKADAEMAIQNTLQQKLLPALTDIAAQDSVSDPQKTAQMLSNQVATQVVTAVQNRVDNRAEAAQKSIDTTISAASATGLTTPANS